MKFKPSWRASEQIVGSHVDRNNKAARNAALRKMERTARGLTRRWLRSRVQAAAAGRVYSAACSRTNSRMLIGARPVSRVKSSVMRS